MPETIQKSVIRDIGHFASLREEWSELVDRSTATVYQTWEWLFTWWDLLGKAHNRSLEVVVYRDRASIIGILPLFIETHRVLSVEYFRRLRLMGCNVFRTDAAGVFAHYSPSDYLDVIVARGYEQEVAEGLLEHVSGYREEVDQVEFANVSDESHIVKTFLPLLQNGPFRHVLLEVDTCPRVMVPKSMKDFLDRLRGSVRRRYSQAYRACTDPEKFDSVNVTDLAEFQGGFSDLVRLHQDRWNKLGYPGIFADSGWLRFYEKVSKMFLEREWLWFRLLTHEGKTVAARLGFVFKDRIYDYLSGFDVEDSSAHHRPGMGLLLWMIDDAARNGVPIVDLLRGIEPYKFEMTSVVNNIHRLELWPSPKSSTVRHALFRASRGAGRIRSRIMAERMLLKIQMQQNNFFDSLKSYCQFTASRVRQKLQKLTSARRRHRTK
jgi:CelD/BcsL family acetyltransferase involved in cellulose biosynthesis